MGGFRTGDLPPERIELHGKWYYVCAECRYPMLLGHSTIYDVPRPEKGLPGPGDPAQALCDPCYRAQYKRIYPKAPPIPPQDSAFDPLLDLGPVPWDRADWKPPPKTDLEMFEEALVLAKVSGEKPDEVLRQLRAQQNAEITITA